MNRVRTWAGTLRGRLLLGTLALLTVGLLSADLTAYLVLRSHLDERHDRLLSAAAAQLDRWQAKQLRVTPADGTHHVTLTSLPALTPVGALVVLRAPDGTVRLSTAPVTPAADGSVPGYVVREWRPDVPLALDLPDGRSEPVGSVLVGVAVDGDRETLATLLRVELLGAILIVAVAALGGRLLVRRGLSPLRRMAETAARIEQGSREPIVGGPTGTETHDLAVALDRALAARARSEAAARDFLADASHELRTPVAAVRGWAELYAAGMLPDPDDLDAALRSIGSEGERMAALVEQMLALARLDAVARAAVDEPVDVAEVVTQACLQVRPLLGERPQRLTCSLLDSPLDSLLDDDGGPDRAARGRRWIVPGDGTAIRRAVDNLVLNALTHAGPDAEVRVTVRPGPDEVVVDVADTGPGLSAQERDRAFDRFWRGSPGRERSAGGSGLGLAIARAVARGHGGDVSLSGVEPHGLVARLRLPRSTPAASAQRIVSSGAGQPSTGRAALDDVLPTTHTPTSETSTSSAAPPAAPDTGRWAGLPVRRPWLTLAAWLLLIVTALLGARLASGTFETDLGLPGSPSAEAADVLAQHEPDAGEAGATVVLYAADGLEGRRAQVEAFAQRLREVPGVVDVSEPLAAGTVADTGRTAFLTLDLTDPPRSLPSADLDALRAADEAAPSGLEVSYAGLLGETVDTGGRPSHLAEAIGLVTALVVLLVMFGSVAGALLPLVSAAVAVVTGLALIRILASGLTLATIAPTLAAMIGLGCGIDYALFVVTRARQGQLSGREPQAAVRYALHSSGHAVLVAAGTVGIALLGLYASGVQFIGRLGLAATVTLAISALAAVTLTPALLSLLGPRIDRLRVRRPRAEGGADGGVWARYAAWVARHPLPVTGAALLLLAVLTVPLFSLRLGHVDDGSAPAGSTQRVAYDRMAEGFGPGVNGRFTALLRLASAPDSPAGQEILANARTQLASTAGVATLTPWQISPDGAIAVTTVTPTTGPQDAATGDLYDRLRGPTADAIRSSTGADLQLTGQTAAQVDFADRLTAGLPAIVALVVGAAFLLLTLTFRSPVVALKAALMNVISIAASYGVVVAVFQWHWGAGLFGLDAAVPIESYVPMMMFAIVFGLSMDYEVFLLSRVREAWLGGASTTDAVASGLSATARVIGAAALIMISVFAGFALDDNVGVKMLAVGLAVSVAIDATVVRLLLVPAAMVLLGEANWWLPRWARGFLDRYDTTRQSRAVNASTKAGRAAGSTDTSASPTS
ncbi:MMPL family transporter [Spongisporangium articulatum]|uniref:histidine kinase n=1 Tax=Spongisporangium articulatum TaxID=3362603 RepID=A0ABW8ASH4_9ACTN